MICKDCKLNRSPAKFYASNRSTCKDCFIARVKANRLANADHYKAYDRARADRPDRAESRKTYQQTEQGKERQRAASRAWAQRNAHKKSATSAVNNAIRDGRLEKQPCFICGASAEAHHPDYSASLAVAWLCDFHHKQVHKEHRELMREAA